MQMYRILIKVVYGDNIEAVCILSHIWNYMRIDTYNGFNGTLMCTCTHNIIGKIVVFDGFGAILIDT